MEGVKKTPLPLPLHILAVPFPAQSHISAMMHLCKTLTNEPQVVITFANVDSIHERMKQHWSTTRTSIRLEPLPFAWNIPNGYDAYCVQHCGLFVDSADKHLSEELRQLIHRLNSSGSTLPPVRCILSDYFFPWTQRVAEHLHLPHVVLMPGSASWACIEQHLPQLTARGHIFSKDPQDCLIDYVGGISPLERRDLPLYLQRHTDQLWKEHGLKRSQSLDGAFKVLINSFYALEKPAFEYMQQQFGPGKVLPVGPLFFLSESGGREEAHNVLLRDEDVESIRWLDKQTPGSVLYISFGSIAVWSRKHVEELAEALEDTGTRFLWVIRPEPGVEGLPEEVYVKVAGKLKDQGRIISWAPQLQVLKHGSVGGFLTHCGWNSMLESMTNGVAMIGWPWGGEQNTNCKIMVDEWKLGAGLVGGKVDKEELCRVIKFVLEGNAELKRRVEEVKSLASQAVDKADIYIKAFVDELREQF